MNRKTASILMIAVVCGLGAMIASSRMLAGGPATTEEIQQIVLAARDLSVEEVLKPDMIKMEPLAKSAIPPGAFTSFRDLADRWVQIKTLEGEPIVEKKLAPKGTPIGLIARIPKGSRAFAITVNEQTGVSGFIMPEHRVDVFQIQSAASGEGTRAVPVLQDVLVLASGTNVQGSTSTDRTIQARTVTVAVTPEEAAILTAAQSKGQLSLALRGMNDHDKTSIEEPPADLLPKVSMTPPAAPEPKPEPKAGPKSDPGAGAETAPRYVTIYRGPSGKREQIRVDQPPGAEETGLGFPSATDLASAPAEPPQTTPSPMPQ